MKLRRRSALSAGGEGHGRSVFFNRVWFAGAALALLGGMVAGKPALALFALLILLTAGLAWGWNRICLSRVDYQREFSATRVFPGELVTMTIRIGDWKPLPVTGLGVDEEIADALIPLDQPTSLGATPGRRTMHFTTSIRPYERISWPVTVRCERRGWHPVGPAVLRASDPFGFFTSRATVEADDAVLVYPRVHALRDLGFPTRQPFGETRTSRDLLTDPSRVIGVRDYRPDDPFRSIHWKATARLMRLQVRVNEPAASLQLGVFINLDTFEHYWEGLDIELSERAIEVGASIAAWAVAERYAVGVYANGIVAGSDQPLRAPPGRGPNQLPRLLEGMAKITPYSTVSFTRMLKTETVRFPWGSTAVIVTSMMPAGLSAQLAAMIASGLRLVLVPLDTCPIPRLPGLVVRPLSEVESHLLEPAG
jgi:uncharacterized protein (DUF58 family)